MNGSWFSVLRKDDAPADASEEELLNWTIERIRLYSVEHGFNHRQVQRIFDAGLCAKHCLTAPMVDGYDSPFGAAN